MNPRFYFLGGVDVVLRKGLNTAKLVLQPAAEIKITTYNTNADRYPYYRLTNLATKATIKAWKNDEGDLHAGFGGWAKNPWQVLKVPPGRYKISASSTAKQGLTFKTGKTRIVDAPAGSRASTSFAVKPGGALKGKVTPKPSRSIKVERYGQVCAKSNKGFVSCSYLSKYGNYTLRYLPPGKYTIHFVAGRSKNRVRADYYRAGKPRVRLVGVKEGRTTKLKTTRLGNRVVRPSWAW